MTIPRRSQEVFEEYEQLRRSAAAPDPLEQARALHQMAMSGTPGSDVAARQRDQIMQTFGFSHEHVSVPPKMVEQSFHDEHGNVHEAGLLHDIAQGVGNAVSWVGEGMKSPFHLMNDAVSRANENAQQQAASYGPGGQSGYLGDGWTKRMDAEFAQGAVGLGADTAVGYGALKLLGIPEKFRKGVGNIVNKVRDRGGRDSELRMRIPEGPLYNKAFPPRSTTTSPAPGNSFYHEQLKRMTDDGLIQHVLTDQAPWERNPHWPRTGPREGSVNLEIELMQGLNEIKQMLQCLCGASTNCTFMGMPHCKPGEGCCSNIDPNSFACGSCGNPAATGNHMGMALCMPGQPGCNQNYQPGSESVPQMAAEHEDWAEKTNHGQYRMPGEPVKPANPMQIAASTWVTEHSNLDSDW